MEPDNWRVEFDPLMYQAWLDHQGLQEVVNEVLEWAKQCRENGPPANAHRFRLQNPALYRAIIEGDYGWIEVRYLMNAADKHILVVDLS